MISLIVTVLNEGESIHRLMRSLACQTFKPDEVVIVDGGSQDDTVAAIRSYADQLPLRVLVEPGCNISAGRNRAIIAAQGDIIAVTDAGVELHPGWLEQITRPLLENPSLNVVSGFFDAAPQTVFEAAMGAAVLPLVDEVNPHTFLPSSRSIAFRKSAWEKAGGYPEWLDYCEDLILDFRLRAVAGNFGFAPDARVNFRPRGSLKAYFKQYYRYARGDGKADLWRKRHVIRYMTYLVAAPLLVLASLKIHKLVWLLFLPGGLVYLHQPYRRLPTVMRRLPHVTARDWLYAAALVPVIRIMGDVAKMLGYPVGWLWRWPNNPPDWKL